MAKRKRSHKEKLKGGLKLGGKKAVNFIIGAGLLSGARRLPDFAGPYQGAVDKILVGGGTKLAGISGQSDLLTAGMKEALADVIDLELIPRLGRWLGGLLGGGASQKAGAAPVYNASAYRA